MAYNETVIKQEKKLDVSKTIEDRLIVPIITKLVLTDLKYMVLLRSTFQKAWFNKEEQNYAILIDLAIGHFKEKGKLPTFSDVGLVISKELGSSDKEKARALIMELKSLQALNLSDYTKEYIDHESIVYLKKVAILSTFMMNMENITNPSKALQIAETISEFHSMSFDNDLGLNFVRDIREVMDSFRLSVNRIPTGIKFLDDNLNGGFPSEGKTLSVFIAGTHVGKSLILSNIAANVLKLNKFALIISLEMSEKVYAQRICCHVAECPPCDLDNPENDETVTGKIMDINKKYPDALLMVKEMPPATTCCRDIQLYIRKLIQTLNRKPDIVLIDYLTIVGPNDPKAMAGQNTNTKYKAVAEEMRALSYEFECPFVTAAQFNRDGSGDTEPDLQQVGEAYAIAQTADYAALLFWKDRENDRRGNTVYVTVEKNRISGKFVKGQRMIMNYMGDLRMLDIAGGITSAFTSRPGGRISVASATSKIPAPSTTDTSLIDELIDNNLSNL